MSIGAIIFIMHFGGFSVTGVSDIAIVKGPNRDLSVGIFSGSLILSIGIAAVIVNRLEKKAAEIEKSKGDLFSSPKNASSTIETTQHTGVQFNPKINELEKENQRLKEKVKRLMGERLKLKTSSTGVHAKNNAKFEQVTIAQDNGIDAIISIVYSGKVSATRRILTREPNDEEKLSPSFFQFFAGEEEKESNTDPLHTETEEITIFTNQITMHIESRMGKIFTKTISGGRYDFLGGSNSGYRLDIYCAYDDGNSLRRCIEVARKMGFACQNSNFSADCRLERAMPKVEEQTKLLTDISERIVNILRGAKLE